jgi:uncharacterized secreted repeat protein (TIGR03808 family)
MSIGRRQVLLGSLGFGVSSAAGPRLAEARQESDPSSSFTHGIVPGGGEIDQTATLQLAADEAAEKGAPLFLPAGVYSTGRLDLKSGTQIEGRAGRSILRYRDGSAILSFDGVENVRLAGLVLDGEGKPLGDNGSLLVAKAVNHLDISDCRFVGSSEDAVVLRKAGGSIRNCEIGNIRKGGLFSEDARDWKSLTTMCTIAATTASWCGARRRARTAPSSR